MRLPYKTMRPDYTMQCYSDVVGIEPVLARAVSELAVEPFGLCVVRRNRSKLHVLRFSTSRDMRTVGLAVFNQSAKRVPEGTWVLLTMRRLDMRDKVRLEHWSAA